MTLLRPIACLSLWLLLVSTTIAQEKKKPLAIEDLYLMESVKSPALFPKEEKLVYERVWIDAKTKTERHALWMVTEKRENRKPLEKNEPDGRAPVISPDGQWIAFLSSRRFPAGSRNIPWVPPHSDAGVDLWLYHVKTEKIMPLGGPDRPWGRVFHDGFYGRVAFSPDSSKLMFVADDGKDPRTPEEIENDVEIVRPDQGEGYTGYGTAQIWVAELNALPDGRGSSKITRLTNDDIWYSDPQWSPDGKSLVAVANKSKDRESVRFSINKNFDLYLIDVATKKQTPLTTNPGPDVSPRWSPDGKQIAYLSSPRKGPHRDLLDLNIMTVGNRPTIQTLIDNHDGKYPSGRALFFPLPNVCWTENEWIWHRIDFRTETTSDVIDVKTGERPTGTLKGPEWRLQGALVRFEMFQNEWARERLSSEEEVVDWKNDGFKIEGVFTPPLPGIAKPPYKLIVYPHGGPHGRSQRGFDFTVQLFAAHGYAVFQPNFRGSTGYGKKFLDADRLDLGGGDMRDILTGIDKLVKDGLVDPKRQFVYGISYGGFMTSWLVGHTHQFKAAVAQNAVTDMNMMYGLSDLQSWTTWELGGLPWEQPERYKKHSPLTYADKVKTPTLILHARDDRRCPLPMGKAFHQALLANNVPTQMVIYPNEGHGIRSPRHREDVYRRVLAWFEKHDK